MCIPQLVSKLIAGFLLFAINFTPATASNHYNISSGNQQLPGGMVTGIKACVNST